MYGDGSDGAFNHTSGTTTLALDTKHQFTTFNVASGARLEASGVGSVLYICATESINIDGTVVAWNTQRGQNSLSVTIDGVTYTSPGTAGGGNGGGSYVPNGGSHGNGFGGGGGGGTVLPGDGSTLAGGAGGTGGRPGGLGGAGRTAGNGQYTGLPGGTSAGGGGALLCLSTASRSSGKGGDAYGSNGTSSTATDNHIQGGGGGGGGNSGMPGVHIVLMSPTVAINGQIFTRIDTQQANGSQGGSGASGWFGTASNPSAAGGGGGGGGGANAGNIYLAGQTVNHSSAFLGTFGGGGGPGGPGYQAGVHGGSGTDGVLYATIIIPPQPYGGPFYRVWDGTEWQYVSGKVFNESVFKPSKPTIL